MRAVGLSDIGVGERVEQDRFGIRVVAAAEVAEQRPTRVELADGIRVEVRHVQVSCRVEGHSTRKDAGALACIERRYECAARRVLVHEAVRYGDEDIAVRKRLRPRCKGKRGNASSAPRSRMRRDVRPVLDRKWIPTPSSQFPPVSAHSAVNPGDASHLCRPLRLHSPRWPPPLSPRRHVHLLLLESKKYARTKYVNPPPSTDLPFRLSDAGQTRRSPGLWTSAESHVQGKEPTFLLRAPPFSASASSPCTAAARTLFAPDNPPLEMPRLSQSHATLTIASYCGGYGGRAPTEVDR